MYISDLAVTEEVLVCPFCGAPHGETIPVGVVQVKCHYCGAEVLVPPRLGGVVQRCPNHPAVLALGLCNDCSRSFCDQCLFVFEADHAKLNLCSKCFESRNAMSRAVSVLGLVFSVVFLLAFIVVVATPFQSDASSAVGLLFISLFTMTVSLAEMRIRKKAVSIREFRARTGSQPFMKKCVKCAKEIPIASEQCRYCQATQPEYVG